MDLYKYLYVCWYNMLLLRRSEPLYMACGLGLRIYMFKNGMRIICDGVSL